MRFHTIAPASLDKRLGSFFGAIAFCVPALFVAPALADTVSWVGGDNGSWSQAANWSSGALPGQGGVVDSVALGAANTTVPSGIFNLAELNGFGRLAIGGGVLDLAAPSQLGALSQTGGQLRGNGDLTIAGAAYFYRATHIGSGKTVLQGASKIDGSDYLGGGPLGVSNRIGGLNLDGGRVLLNQNDIGLERGRHRFKLQPDQRR